MAVEKQQDVYEGQYEETHSSETEQALFELQDESYDPDEYDGLTPDQAQIVMEAPPAPPPPLDQEQIEEIHDIINSDYESELNDIKAFGKKVNNPDSGDFFKFKKAIRTLMKDLRKNDDVKDVFDRTGFLGLNKRGGVREALMKHPTIQAVVANYMMWPFLDYYQQYMSKLRVRLTNNYAAGNAQTLQTLVPRAKGNARNPEYDILDARMEFNPVSSYLDREKAILGVFRHPLDPVGAVGSRPSLSILLNAGTPVTIENLGTASTYYERVDLLARGYLADAVLFQEKGERVFKQRLAYFKGKETSVSGLNQIAYGGLVPLQGAIVNTSNAKALIDQVTIQVP